MQEKIKEQCKGIFWGIIGIIIGIVGGCCIMLSDKSASQEVLFGILFFSLGGVFVLYMSIRNLNKLRKELQQIENRYKNALKGTDKAEALRLGRIYYASLRDGGIVTTYDEQAIANDLNTIMSTVYVVNTVTKVGGGDPNLNSLIANQNRLYCSNCGNVYLPSEDKKFCKMCGNRL